MKFSNFKPLGYLLTRYNSVPTLVASVDVETGFWIFKKVKKDVKIVRELIEDNWYFLADGKPAYDVLYLEVESKTLLEHYNKPLVARTKGSSNILEV